MISMQIWDSLIEIEWMIVIYMTHIDKLDLLAVINSLFAD